MQIRLKKLTPIGLVLSLLGTVPTFGQTVEDLAAQVEELKKGQDQIRQQLQEIRTLLQQRQAPTPTGRSERGWQGLRPRRQPGQGSEQRQAHPGRVHRLSVTVLRPARP